MEPSVSVPALATVRHLTSTMSGTQDDYLGGICVRATAVGVLDQVGMKGGRVAPQGGMAWDMTAGLSYPNSILSHSHCPFEHVLRFKRLEGTTICHSLTVVDEDFVSDVSCQSLT